MDPPSSPSYPLDLFHYCGQLGVVLAPSPANIFSFRLSFFPFSFYIIFYLGRIQKFHHFPQRPRKRPADPFRSLPSFYLMSSLFWPCQAKVYIPFFSGILRIEWFSGTIVSPPLPSLHHFFVRSWFQVDVFWELFLPFMQAQNSFLFSLYSFLLIGLSGDGCIPQ